MNAFVTFYNAFVQRHTHWLNIYEKGATVYTQRMVIMVIVLVIMCCILKLLTEYIIVLFIMHYNNKEIQFA